jgi:hypothetical protein
MGPKIKDIFFSNKKKTKKAKILVQVKMNLGDMQILCSNFRFSAEKA